jgi:hypothetical protein
MGQIAVESLVPGMKLAKPVTNKSGLVLLGEETELTTLLIQKIKDMGLSSVHVQGASKVLPPKDEVLAQLDNRFKTVEALPYMGMLKRLLVEHTESLYEQHGSGDPQR